MQKATFDLPSSLFEVKWGSKHNPDNHNIDRFRLFEGAWHWHRSYKDDLNEIQLGTSASLRGISTLFATHNDDGEALYAQFFCAPGIESVIKEDMEDSLAIFPIDAIFEEIENVFSKIKYSYLEYGAGRKWMVARFSSWGPSHYVDGTENSSHHLFWFDAEGIEDMPKLVYINHEMPEDLSAGDTWKSWELLLKSSEHLILCTAPRGEPAVCQILDLSFEPGPNAANPIDFLSSCSKSLTVVPDAGLEDNWGGLRDNWGYLVFGKNADLDSLGLEFIPD